MAVSNDFLEYIRDQLREWGQISVRRMFGGAGLYRDGKMFGLVADDVIYLKVDDTNREKYEAAGSGPLKPFKDQNTVLSFYEVPPDIFESPVELIEWADESLAIQKKAQHK
jgi:DNA transformation protein